MSDMKKWSAEKLSLLDEGDRLLNELRDSRNAPGVCQSHGTLGSCVDWLMRYRISKERAKNGDDSVNLFGRLFPASRVNYYLLLAIAIAIVGRYFDVESSKLINLILSLLKGGAA